MHIKDLRPPARFGLLGEPLRTTHLITHKIVTIHYDPIRVTSYRHPQALNTVLDQEVEKLIEFYIVSLSNSPYDFPMWIVLRKLESYGEEKWRTFTDFQQVHYSRKWVFAADKNEYHQKCRFSTICAPGRSQERILPGTYGIRRCS